MEKQIKVIICADDGEWSRENTDALASRGAQVVTVNRNGTALLTKIRDEKPDVVVMDLFMAGVDALDRRLTQEEYDRVCDHLLELGLEDGFVQELSSSDEKYIPLFDLTGI